MRKSVEMVTVLEPLFHTTDDIYVYKTQYTTYKSGGKNAVLLPQKAQKSLFNVFECLFKMSVTPGKNECNKVDISLYN